MAGNTSKSTTKRLKTGTNNQVVKITAPTLRDFLIHFRRPTLTKYNGLYGFDWLRDEYVYDYLKVIENQNSETQLYRGDVHELIKEYTRFKSSDTADVKELANIKPTNGEPYVPAWLSITPMNSTTLKGVPVDLHLQVDQENSDDDSELTNDGTIIEFITSPSITITPNSINLGDLIKGGRLPPKTLNSSNNVFQSKTIHRYRDESTTFKIESNVKDNLPGSIQIKARLKGIERIVGLLMIYPNIPKTCEIVPYKFSSVLGNTSVTVPQYLEDYLAQTLLRQACITSKIEKIKLLNIADLKQQYEKLQKTDFTMNRGIALRLIDSFLTQYPSPSVRDLTESEADAFPDDLAKVMAGILRETINDSSIDGLYIDSDNHKKTFLVFTNYYNSATAGMATWDYKEIHNQSCNSEQCYIDEAGNLGVMYKYDGSKYHALTTIHELGHTLGLPHTFETSSSAKHQFYQGYTDNIMDYNDKLDPSGINQDIQLNEFYENNLASFKWQWDIIRNDRSIY